MIKAMVVYTEVDDPQKFLRFFTEEMYPLLVKLPEVQDVSLTKILPMSTEIAQEVTGIQFILEVYFETLEAMDTAIQSSHGYKLSNLGNRLPTGRASIFTGNEKNIDLRIHFPNSKIVDKSDYSPVNFSVRPLF